MSLWWALHRQTVARKQLQTWSWHTGCGDPAAVQRGQYQRGGSARTAEPGHRFNEPHRAAVLRKPRPRDVHDRDAAIAPEPSHVFVLSNPQRLCGRVATSNAEEDDRGAPCRLHCRDEVAGRVHEGGCEGARVNAGVLRRAEELAVVVVHLQAAASFVHWLDVLAA